MHTKEMVALASSLATKGGEEIAMGGTAADAMIAVQTVLGLVEPQSSGIAGEGFVVWCEGDKKEITATDSREKAPSNATEDCFVDFKTFETAQKSGASLIGERDIDGLASPGKNPRIRSVCHSGCARQEHGNFPHFHF